MQNRKRSRTVHLFAMTLYIQQLNEEILLRHKIFFKRFFLFLQENWLDTNLSEPNETNRR